MENNVTRFKSNGPAPPRTASQLDRSKNTFEQYFLKVGAAVSIIAAPVLSFLVFGMFPALGFGGSIVAGAAAGIVKYYFATSLRPLDLGDDSTPPVSQERPIDLKKAA